MTHVVLPDWTTIDIHDHGRGQANGVATLNAQGKLVQDPAANYLFAESYPSPDGVGTLVDWTYRQFTA